MLAFSTTDLQPKDAIPKAEPIESPNRFVFASEDNGKFENWEATCRTANNLTPKTNFQELSQFFDDLQKLNSYDINPIWKKTLRSYILTFVIYNFALVICYSLVFNLSNKGTKMFAFLVVFTVQFLVVLKSIQKAYEKELTSRLREIMLKVVAFNNNVLEKRGLILRISKQGSWQVLIEKGDKGPQFGTPNDPQMKSESLASANDLKEVLVEIELKDIKIDRQVDEERNDAKCKKFSSDTLFRIGSMKTGTGSQYTKL